MNDAVLKKGDKVLSKIKPLNGESIIKYDGFDEIEELKRHERIRACADYLMELIDNPDHETLEDRINYARIFAEGLDDKTKKGFMIALAASFPLMYQMDVMANIAKMAREGLADLEKLRPTV